MMMDKKITLYHTDGSARFQTLATTTVSSQSAAVSASRILLVSATDHYVEFGSNPTADATGFVIPANAPMQWNFVGGQKVAARTHSGSGHLSIVDLD